MSLCAVEVFIDYIRHIINKLNVIIWSEVDSQTQVSCGNNIVVSFVHLSYLLANKKVIIIIITMRPSLKSVQSFTFKEGNMIQTKTRSIMFPEIRPASFSNKLQTYQSETKTAFKKACQENSLGFCGSRD